MSTAVCWEAVLPQSMHNTHTQTHMHTAGRSTYSVSCLRWSVLCRCRRGYRHRRVVWSSRCWRWHPEYHAAACRCTLCPRPTSLGRREMTECDHMHHPISWQNDNNRIQWKSYILQKYAAPMPLLTATSALGLWRRHLEFSSSVLCYLHHLCIVFASIKKRTN